MRKSAALLAAFLAGVLFALLGAVVLQPARAESVQAIQITSTFPPAPTSTPVPTSTVQITSTFPAPTSAPEQIAGGLGWAGEMKCLNCTPLKVRVKLSHYNPTAYDPMYPQLNCWDYSEPHKYCLSPTWIGVPWETGWGLFSACPAVWAVGSWLEVPGVITTICMDQGGDIVCEGDLCRVDVLGPGGAAWDGKEYEAVLWVPRSFLIRYAERNKEQ